MIRYLQFQNKYDTIERINFLSMPWELEHTTLPSDRKLYPGGRFAPDTYEKAQVQLNWWGEVTLPKRWRVTAIREREKKDRMWDRNDAQRWIAAFIWESAPDTIVSIDDTSWGITLRGTLDKSKNLFTGYYESASARFEWTGRMTPSTPFPRPIEWTLTQKGRGDFHRQTGKFLDIVIKYADGKVVTEDTLSLAQSNPRADSTDTKMPDVNPILANIWLLDRDPAGTANSTRLPFLWILMAQASIKR